MWGIYGYFTVKTGVETMVAMFYDGVWDLMVALRFDVGSERWVMRGLKTVN